MFSLGDIGTALAATSSTVEMLGTDGARPGIAVTPGKKFINDVY